MITGLAVALMAAGQLQPAAVPPRFRPSRTSEGRGSRITLLAPPVPALFEFAPANGIGIPAVCSTTAPTGKLGETMTFTRASGAYCTKSAGAVAGTGIANGDMVVLADNVARIEYDSGGVRGLRVERATTNFQTQSQALDGAPWINLNFGAATVTVTANYAVAPDGTTTAERLQLSAVDGAAGETASVYDTGYTTQNYTTSLYVRGTSGSGTISLCVGVVPLECTPCAFVSTSWTRCSKKQTTAAGDIVLIGNAGVYDANQVHPAADVLVWGVQSENLPYPTSYVPTTGAAAGRAVEVATFPAVTGIASAGSGAATISAPWNFGAIGTNVVSQNNVLRTTTANAGSFAYFVPSTGQFIARDGTTNIVLNPTASTWPQRVWNSYSGSTHTLNLPELGLSATGAFDGTWEETTIRIGSNGAGILQLDGVISRVCIDSNPLRCR